MRDHSRGERRSLTIRPAAIDASPEFGIGTFVGVASDRYAVGFVRKCGRFRLIEKNQPLKIFRSTILLASISNYRLVSVNGERAYSDRTYVSVRDRGIAMWTASLSNSQNSRHVVEIRC
jgi:hypothetical protein